MAVEDTTRKQKDEKDKRQSPPKRDDYDSGDATKSRRLPGTPTTPAPKPRPKPAPKKNED